MCLHVPFINVATVTTIQSLETQVHMELPSKYTELHEVFSKTKATGFPLDNTYDSTIELLEGHTSPHNCIFPLSTTETQAMNKYIEEARKQGYDHPSISPASTGFFLSGEQTG